MGKVSVFPNGVNAIPSQVTAWLDARGPDAEQVLAVVAELRALAGAAGGSLLQESWTEATGFDAGLADRVGAVLPGAPVLGTGAGHDAGILANAGIATAMLFVRNPTGVSHSPAEHAELADCHAGVRALTAVVAELAGIGTGSAGSTRSRRTARVRQLLGAVRLAARRCRRAGPAGRRRPAAGSGSRRACRPADQDVRLPGLVLPGFANTHSHAFHRALRGRTHDGGGTFWTWRDRMYALARRLEPEAYYLLARAVYAEMALAGITAVGEFHYLHHQLDGSRYPDPNAFGHALLAGGRRGRHPDHPARHLLSQRRPRPGRPPRTRRRPAPVQRRLGRRLATAGGAAGRVRERHRPDRRGDPLGPGGAGRPAGRGGRGLGRPAAARPRLRAAGRERGHPGALRLQPDRAAGRARLRRPAAHRGARHPPERVGHRAATGGPGPTSASARPPSATWPTASGRRRSWRRPGPG